LNNSDAVGIFYNAYGYLFGDGVFEKVVGEDWNWI
jgi:hypothetical protein